MEGNDNPVQTYLDKFWDQYGSTEETEPDKADVTSNARAFIASYNDEVNEVGVSEDMLTAHFWNKWRGAQLETEENSAA